MGRNPMTGVIQRRKCGQRHTDTQGERHVNLGTGKDTKDCQPPPEDWRGAWSRFPLDPPEGTNPADTWIPDFQPLDRRQQFPLSKGSQCVVLCMAARGTSTASQVEGGAGTKALRTGAPLPSLWTGKDGSV